MIAPVKPISFQPFERVISVNENEIYREVWECFRRAGRIAAELLDPDDLASTRLSHLPMGDASSPTVPADPEKAAEERVNPHQHSLRIHYLAKAQSIYAMEYAYFSKTLSPSRILSEACSFSRRRVRYRLLTPKEVKEEVCGVIHNVRDKTNRRCAQSR